MLRLVLSIGLVCSVAAAPFLEGSVVNAQEAVLESSSVPAGMSQRSLAKIARAAKKNKKNKPGGGLGAVCKSIRPIVALWKVTAGGHIVSGPRVTGYSLICSRKECPKKFPAEFYYSDGSLAGKVGAYGRWIGNGQIRAYGGTNGAPQHFVSAIRKNAKKSGRDGNLYIQMGAYCASVSAASNRSGSPF